MKLKKCSRCNADIACNASDITNCSCNSIILSEATLQFLAANHNDCFCNACLQHFDQLVADSKALTFPRDSKELEENVHYYIENGFFVFTELYHMLRGHCCRSGCRHCVYGFLNDKR
jgi:Family of unknown function (DUF5522)/Cysteine-rich CWC